MKKNLWMIGSTVFTMVIIGTSANAHAQVGKSLELIDLNTATEKDLSTLPHMTAELAKSIVNARPFASITAVNTHLLNQKLTHEQAGELYRKAFVHINLNTATREEIMLIPGAGRKMAHEFAEYRPWKTWAQFNKEIGKYVGPKETARLAQYCFIPLNVNKASDEEMATIPGVTKALIEKMSKGKPWKTIEDLEKELAKTVGEKEAKRIARYLTAK